VESQDSSIGPEDLEKATGYLVPAYSEWQRRVGRFIKYAL
jgi:hypothetical protein